MRPAHILERIAAYKRQAVEDAKSTLPLSALRRRAEGASAARGFRAALEAQKSGGRSALIAEIKKASPSKGIIRADFDPERLARAYQRGGATCLSVLTDEPSFQGAPEHLRRAREATSLPVLRKDFMLDTYQIVESRALGADCVLVILTMVDNATARELLDVAKTFAMDALVEVHDEREVERALRLDATFIGINNRNLRTFTTDLETSIRLRALLPPECHVVAESGLSAPEDLQRLMEVGITSFLVGESLMRAEDVEDAARELLAGASR